ncbi:MAG: hypothetical protein QXS20_08640 [Candidatus Thorarchaeota archaeon]
MSFRRTDFIMIVAAVALGLTVLTYDLLTGTISMAMGSTGFIMVMLCVGIVSGGMKNSLISAVLVLAGMIAVGYALYEIAIGSLPEDPFTAVISIMMLLTTRQLLYPDEENPCRSCFLVLILVPLAMVIAPIIYAVSLLFALLGGLLGSLILTNLTELFGRTKKEGTNADTVKEPDSPTTQS